MEFLKMCANCKCEYMYWQAGRDKHMVNTYLQAKDAWQAINSALMLFMEAKKSTCFPINYGLYINQDKEMGAITGWVGSPIGMCGGFEKSSMPGSGGRQH